MNSGEPEKRSISYRWPAIFLMGALTAGGFLGGLAEQKFWQKHTKAEITQPIRPAILEAIYEAQKGIFLYPDTKKCFDGLQSEIFSRQTLLDYHNLVREESGLKNLQESPVLDSTAQITADYLSNNYQKPFQHPQIPKAGIELIEQRFQANAMAMHFGENLAFGRSDNIAGDMRCFIESKDHLENIINPRFKFVGFGDSVAPNGSEYLVIHFAS